MDDLDLDALFDAVQAQTAAARSAAAAPAGPGGAAAAAPDGDPVATATVAAAASTATALPAAAAASDMSAAAGSAASVAPSMPTAVAPAPCPNADAGGKCHQCTCGEARALRTRIGQITRDLHESLKELRLDKTLAEMAVEIPDARNRLKYVTEMCERSAQKVLDALDMLGPIHDGLRVDADALHRRWDRMLEQRARPDDGFMRLFEDTRAYLGSVSARTSQAGSLHTEIMMAQDFQDLTGQVCRKIEGITERIESQLIHMLIDTAPEELKPRNLGMLEGPQVTQDRADAVSSQGEVDALLSSLGF